MSRANLEVIVIGGGAFGLSTALELRRRGHDVALFDPGPIPRPEASSTDISKAVRLDYGSDELYARMAEQALETWDDWNGRWSPALYHQDGFLLLSGGPMQPGGFEHDGFELLSSRGHVLERIDSQVLAARFPDWNAERYPDGYYNPRGGWAESGAVIRWLAEEARATGVALCEGLGMQRLIERGSKVAGIVTDDGESHAADFVVLAAGAWTPSLLPELQQRMWAIAQPVLHFRPENPSRYRYPAFPVWAADIANTGWYGFPANAEGVLKVANHGPGRRVDPDAPRVVDPAEEARFRRFFEESLPSLAGAPLVHTRICLYCDTWDGNFWIDRHPDRPGLVVASGGSGHGFKFVSLLGGIVADCLEELENPFAGRFRWRERGRLSSEDARHGVEERGPAGLADL